MTETQQPKPGEAGYSAGLLIRDVPQDERPRERLRDQGSQALSNSELLAILLRVGRRNESAVTMATRLLRDMDGLKGLQQASFHELSSQSGLAMAKTAQIKAALELGRRLQAEAPEEKPVISGPEDVYNIVGSEMVFLEHEELRVLVLDTRNHVVHVEALYRGTVNSSQVRTAEVFREAVRRNQPNVIVVHNHPSGDPTPSPDDERTTRHLVEAGKALEIQVLDHIVVAHNQGTRYVSMRNMRLGFDS